MKLEQKHILFVNLNNMPLIIKQCPSCNKQPVKIITVCQTCGEIIDPISLSTILYFAVGILFIGFLIGKIY